MPELPEVETIKIGLEANILNKKIKKVFVSNKNLRFKSTIDLKNLESCKITKIERRARYLILSITPSPFQGEGGGEGYNKLNLIIHLGMSGRLIYKKTKKYQTLKHDHFICQFDDGFLIFNDPRRFGFVDLILAKNLSQHKMLKNLGLEPFDKKFTAKYLLEKLKNRTQNIKTTIMDNQNVVGVGNIYANESLFATKISPLRKANSLKIDEVKKLVEAIKNILKKAIKSGGSSINDYVDAKGNLGNFQNNFKIYGLAGKKCVVCNAPIKRIVQNGRSTFYCEKCQK